MRDRLVELLCNVKCEGEECFGNCPYRIGQKCNKVQRLEMCSVFAIADHLLAEGVIVPPVKVGDIVYSYLHSWREEDGIAPYQITNITITQNKKGVWTKKYRAMQFDGSKTIDWQLNFDFDEIGETVFLTRSEAEKALGRSGNGK